MSNKEDWTPEEEEILRQQYAATPNSTLAARLGRSKSSIVMKASRLGIAKEIREKPDGFANQFELMTREETLKLDKIDLLSVNWSLLEMFQRELSNTDLRARDRIRLMHALSSHTANINTIMRGTEDQLGAEDDLKTQFMHLEYKEGEHLTPRRINYRRRTYTLVE